MGELVTRLVEEGTCSLDLRPAIGSPVTSFYFHQQMFYVSDFVIEGVKAIVNVQSGVVSSHRSSFDDFEVRFFSNGAGDKPPNSYVTFLSMHEKYKSWVTGTIDPRSRDGQAFIRRLAIELDIE